MNVCFRLQVIVGRHISVIIIHDCILFSYHSYALEEFLIFIIYSSVFACTMQWGFRKPGELLADLIYQLLAYITWKLMLWWPGKGIVL